MIVHLATKADFRADIAMRMGAKPALRTHPAGLLLTERQSLAYP